MTRGSRAGIAALGLVLALTSGCFASKDVRKGANELEDALGTPDWATSVTVKSGLDGQYADQVLIEVALDDSATAEDVTAFVLALPGEVVDAGLEDVSANEKLTFVSPSQSRLAIEWGATVSSDEVGRGAAEWFGVVDALGAGVVATARTDGGSSYVVTLPDGERSAVADTYVTLAGLTQPDTAWDVLATDGALSLDLSGSVLPTEDQLTVWRSLVAALDGLPADLPASLLSLHLLDRTVVDVTVTAPDETTTESSPSRRTATGSGRWCTHSWTR